MPNSLWLLTFRAVLRSGPESGALKAKTAGNSATEKWQISGSILQTSAPVTRRDSKTSIASKSWGCQAFGISPPDEIVSRANWFPVDFQSSLRTYFPFLFSQVEMATKICGYQQLPKLPQGIFPLWNIRSCTCIHFPSPPELKDKGRCKYRTSPGNGEHWWARGVQHPRLRAGLSLAAGTWFPCAGVYWG